MKPFFLPYRSNQLVEQFPEKGPFVSLYCWNISFLEANNKYSRGQQNWAFKTLRAHVSKVPYHQIIVMVTMETIRNSTFSLDTYLTKLILSLLLS